uniref:Uncharacterized protein n=1 Tax=Alexandrium catenella TaxID=2925 RepID=A0A7S1M633_ALECA
MLSQQALLEVGKLDADDSDDEDWKDQLKEDLQQTVQDLTDLAKMEDSEEVARVAILLDDLPRPWTPPSILTKVAEAPVKYFDTLHLLVVVTLSDEEEKKQTATVQMVRLKQIIMYEEKLVMHEDSMWLLQDKKTVQMLGAKVLFAQDSCGLGVLECPFGLRRCLGDKKAGAQTSEVIALAAKHYGGAIVFPFAWTRYYARSLWVFMLILLPPVCILGALLGNGMMTIEINATNIGSAEHIIWELIKVISVVWMLMVAKSWPNPDLSGGMAKPAPQAVDGSSPRCGGEGGDIALTVLSAILVVAIQLFLAMLLFVFIFWLELYLAFEWGDCINLGCRDPAVKWGFVGWLVSITPGILEAIFLAVLTEVPRLLADLLLSVRNYQHQEPRLRFKMVALLWLDALAKLGTFGVLALVFVPEWEDEMTLSGLPANFTSMTTTQQRIARNNIDCSDLPDVAIVGRGALLCLRRRLDVGYRRWLFQKAMKGPFVVAPFIAILIKVILPILLQRFQSCFWRCERRAHRGQEEHCCLRIGVTQFIIRFAGLLFAYDGPKIGGLKFLVNGNPFVYGKALRASSEAAEAEASGADAPEGDRGGRQGGDQQPERTEEKEKKHKRREMMRPIRQALREALEKRFSPESIVLDNLLSIQWVGFFTVIWPWGCIPTVLAWVLQTRSAWALLLISKRRVFPQLPDMLLSVSRMFVLIMAHVTALWHVSLSMVTYNSYLSTTSGGVVVGLIAGLWVAAVAVMWLLAWGVHYVATLLHKVEGRGASEEGDRVHV